MKKRRSALQAARAAILLDQGIAIWKIAIGMKSNARSNQALNLLITAPEIVHANTGLNNIENENYATFLAF